MRAGLSRTRSREALRASYTPEPLCPKTLDLVLDSLDDSNNHLLSYRYPVDEMLRLLYKYFKKDSWESTKLSLRITVGTGGSKLSHNHSQQFSFVEQTLELWREIQHNIFRLWKATDEDLLDISNRYTLTNTGQGLNRLQRAPKVSKAMTDILQTVKQRHTWVGLSVVHLGDFDVPNPLVFIDKYSQVPRILQPIVQVIHRIHELDKLPACRPFFQAYGGGEGAIKTILCDFFKHGFDGSGDDGGSCIDGRLTSAWNWCSRLDKKPYQNIFLLSGFQGFDGSFRR